MGLPVRVQPAVATTTRPRHLQRWRDAVPHAAHTQRARRAPLHRPARGQVLAAEREPWLAIDPKPYIGDPTYDPLQHLLNCNQRLVADPRGFARRIADLLHLDADRLQLWLFARCVIESAEWSQPCRGCPPDRTMKTRGPGPSVTTMKRHLSAAEVAELADLLDDAPVRAGLVDEVLQAAEQRRGMTLRLRPPPPHPGWTGSTTKAAPTPNRTAARARP